MFSRTCGVARYCLLVLALLLALYVLLAASFVSDPMASPMLRASRSLLLSSMIPAILVSVVLAIPIGALLLPFAGKLRQEEGLGGAWVNLATRSTLVVVPTGLFVVVGYTFSLSMLAPFSTEKSVIAIDGVTVNYAHVSRLSSQIEFDASSRMAGDYISNSSGVWSLADEFPQKIVEARSGSLSDFFVRGSHLFLVINKQLISFDTKERSATLIADLPIAGLRFGQIKRDYGGASDFLLWGNDGERSVVYEIRNRNGGEYTKLAELTGGIVGASTCIERTFVATPSRVIQLQDGFLPIEAFRAPGADRITSIIVRQGDHYDSESCILLIATNDAVYAQNAGISTILLSGVGGNLGAMEDVDLDFTLVDSSKGISANIVFDQARFDQARDAAE